MSKLCGKNYLKLFGKNPPKLKFKKPKKVDNIRPHFNGIFKQVKPVQIIMRLMSWFVICAAKGTHLNLAPIWYYFYFVNAVGNFWRDLKKDNY